MLFILKGSSNFVLKKMIETQIIEIVELETDPDLDHNTLTFIDLNQFLLHWMIFNKELNLKHSSTA